MFWLLLFAGLFAGWRSTDEPDLFFYFFTKVLANVVLFSLALLLGDTSTLYAWAYACLTGLILVAMGIIAWQAIWRISGSLKLLGIPLALAFGLGRLAYAGMAVPLRFAGWIHLIEGCGLFLCAMLVGCAAPYSRRADVLLILSLWWVTLGTFRLGFWMHVSDPHWLALNWVVPPWLGVAGFLLVGWRVKRHLPSSDELAGLLASHRPR